MLHLFECIWKRLFLSFYQTLKTMFCYNPCCCNPCCGRADFLLVSKAFCELIFSFQPFWITLQLFEFISESLFLCFIFLLLLCNVCLLMKYARARSTFRKQAGHLALLLLCRRETGGVSPSPLSRSVPRPHPQDAWVGGSDAHYSGYALAPKWPPPTSLAERHGAVRAGAASPFSKMLLRIRQC